MSSTISTFNAMNLAEFRQKMENTDLESRLKLKGFFDDCYYNFGSETVSDEKYDVLSELCNTSQIGCKLRDTENATKLPFTLNSMDKIKQGDVKKLEKFTNSFSKTSKFIVSDKLNGVSCLVQYGDTPADTRLYTRGDGTVGADISYFKNKINGIISGPTNICVRGELIITKQDFDDHYASDYKNSLSMLVSVVNSKSLKEPIKHIRFVAYEIVTATQDKKPSENIVRLEKLGFYVVPTRSFNALDDSALGNYVQERYVSSVFSIDGIVVQVDAPYDRRNTSASGNPDYAFAYKIITDSCETEVEDVLWAPSRYSTLKPRIQIKPVELCGVTIKYVTGSNAKFIRDNKINVGSRVLVIRAGEIIPKIEEVLTRSKDGGKMPSVPYRWNDAGVDIISTDDDKDDVTVRRLAFFFSTIGVKQIAEGIVRKLVDCGYDDIFKIMEMKEDDFMKIPTFERKMSQRLCNSLAEIPKLDMSTIMAASGLFGHGLGLKKLTVLVDSFPDILVRTPLKSEIEKINGFSDKTASKVLDNLENFKEFMVKFSKYVPTQPVPVKQVIQVKQTLDDEVVVFTNFRDRELERKLVEMGAEIGDSVTKKTTCLVVPDDSSTLSSGKITKAKLYGIKIYEKSEFEKLYNVK